MTFINLPESGSPRFKNPVAGIGDLPTQGNADGDVRVVLSSNTIYSWDEDTSSWVTATGGTGLINLNGLTTGTQTFSTGTSGTDFNISSSGSVHTFNIPNASATARGFVSTGTQTFSGDKTFNGNLNLGSTLVNDKLYKVEKFTLGAGEITAKAVTLASTPTTATLTRLVVINGLEQDYSVDFTISGFNLSWNGLTLDGVLSVGDKIIAIYN